VSQRQPALLALPGPNELGRAEFEQLRSLGDQIGLSYRRVNAQDPASAAKAALILDLPFVEITLCRLQRNSYCLAAPRFPSAGECVHRGIEASVRFLCRRPEGNGMDVQPNVQQSSARRDISRNNSSGWPCFEADVRKGVRLELMACRNQNCEIWRAESPTCPPLWVAFAPAKLQHSSLPGFRPGG